MALDNSSLAIGEGKNVLVAESDRLAVADLKIREVVQAVDIRSAVSLTIYDRPSNEIEFRIVMTGGAQTRPIKTYSITGFGALFAQFGREDKSVEYVES
jgi:hypothetical protein